MKFAAMLSLLTVLPCTRAHAAVVPETCATLAQTAWPVTASGRAQLLTRLDATRDVCIDQPAFLALLGALWLEQGDAAQALLWLERALMLDPDVPGAQADHALALAGMGERTALQELVQRWRGRGDIPPALRQRLEAAVARPRAGSANGSAFATPPAQGWSWRRSMSLLRGHESNLDHSPRLSEITLSSPDGPIDLPLAVPFVPRAGRAWVGEAAVQALTSTAPGTQWQFGLQMAGRHADDEPATDTRQIQLAVARWQLHDGWRSQWQVAMLRVAGSLNEPYSALTLGLAAEREWNGCWGRLGLDAEWRRQSVSAVADSQTTAVQSGLNCSWSRSTGWSAGLAARASLDTPRNPARAGGPQRQLSLGLRAAGPVGAGFRLEMSARQAWLMDGEGYSPLLESNAVRRQRQAQFSLELSRPLPGLYVAGAELVLQVQGLKQRSNLTLFEHQGISSFGGLRWEW